LYIKVEIKASGIGLLKREEIYEWIKTDESWKIEKLKIVNKRTY